jgi:E3 ubiquitin-protein ligase HUWE1
VEYNLAAEPASEGTANSLLTYPEHQSLHMFLNLLFRILKTGHGERVRQVVDSAVIPSLRHILSDLHRFGGPIGTFTSKILAAIIHHEPTSYTALHESGLPQAFLRMVTTYIPSTPELVQTIPNVFDAICINAQGKELFASFRPFEGFFRVFGQVETARAMTKGHHSWETGLAMDELLRHHPDLKEPYMVAYIEMLRDICQDRLSKETPAGTKIPELMPVEEETVGGTRFLASMQRDSRPADEERNLPVMVISRNVLSVLPLSDTLT